MPSMLHLLPGISSSLISTPPVHSLAFSQNLSCFFFLRWLLRTQKLKSHQMRRQRLKILPLKSGVGQYIAMHATLTARYFFTCIFFPNLSRVFPVLAVANTGSYVGPQNKIGHPAGSVSYTHLTLPTKLSV